MKVYGYIRVSSVGQLEGDGPERQADAIRKFCAQHGLELAGFFTDSITGTSEGLTRPEFGEMLSTLDMHYEDASGRVMGVVVERMDRLARDLMIGEVMIAELHKRSIQLFATDQ